MCQFGTKRIYRQDVQGKVSSTYFNCNKLGHRAFECKKSMQPRVHAHMTEVVIGGVPNIRLSAMISEINVVGLNLQEWWINIRATCHVYSIGGCSLPSSQLQMVIKFL